MTATRASMALTFAVLGSAKLVVFVEGHRAFAIPTALLAVVGTVECVVATLLILGDRLGLWAAFFLALALMIGATTMAVLGVDLKDCGCFGPWKVSAALHALIMIGVLWLAVIALLSDVELAKGQQP